MIRSCLLSRTELKDLILKAPRTNDGYYFFPRFPVLLLADGKIKDGGYYYDRLTFKDKICFDEIDLKMLTARKKVQVDTELRHFVDTKLKEAIDGYTCLDLKDKIVNQEYTLEELIDSCIYLTKIKYA